MIDPWNLAIGGLIGLAALLGVRAMVGVAMRGRRSDSIPGYAAAGMIGALGGMVAALYFFPGGDWQAAMAKMEPVTDMASFRRTVLEAETPVVVDVYSPSCPACKVLAPQLGVLAEKYGDRVKFVKVNGQSAPDVRDAYHVMGYPTVLLFSRGKLVNSWLGVQDREVYSSEIEAVLARARQGEASERTTIMQERTGVVTFKGNPLTLVGPELQIGQDAPDFTAIGNDLSPVRLSDHKGKIVVLSAVPSLDTPVCDAQTRTFNEKVAGLDNVEVLTVSMDLPFAQRRWCGDTGVENVTTVSDHRDAEFGASYGMLVKELRLLARGVFVVDQDGKITYIEVVDEMTHEPDYDAALEAVKKLTG
jgi:thiol peroxidase